MAGKGTISYTYDAAGNKIKKITHEDPIASNNNIETTTTTLYIAGMVYESKTDNNPETIDYTDKLQFFGQEEGRTRVLYNNVSAPNAITEFVYDFMLKDHLGNVRMVLTEEQKLDAYPALSYEGIAGSPEIVDQNKHWENSSGQSIDVVNVRANRPDGFAQLVRKSTGAIGATKLLKVMSGDKIHTKVDYYYSTANANNGGANGLSSVVTSLLGSLQNSTVVPSVIKDGATTISDQLNVDGNASGFFTPETGSDGTNQPPKAYLHVLLFDEMFKFDDANSFVQRVAYAPNEIRSIDKFFGNAVQVKKNGYAYVYFSNESDELVYFDNFLLTHERGPLLEETHYYPFGLTMAGISSKSLAYGNPKNKYLYNGIEYEHSFDINIGETFYRTHDPQIGRWWQIDPKIETMTMWSPFVSNYNNPIKYFDFLGDVPGEYYNESGQLVADDGKNDGRVYVIKTTQTTDQMYGKGSYDEKGRTNPISQDAATQTEEELSNGNFAGSHMKNVVEIINRKTMVSVDNFVSDDGTGGIKPGNNREYQVWLDKNGNIIQNNKGAVIDPGNPKVKVASVKSSIDKSKVDKGATTLHTHPSGTKKVKGGTAVYTEPPSKTDINGNRSLKKGTNEYVWSLRNNTFYIYNSTGVIATIPITVLTIPSSTK